MTINPLLTASGLILLVGESSLIRVAIFLLIWLIIWLPLAIPLAKILKWRIQDPLETEQKLPLIASLYLIAPGIVWGAIKIDQSSWSNCGVKLAPEFFLWFFLGIIIAILGLALLLSLEKYLNWLEWLPENLPNLRKIALPILAISIGIGLIEELVFRGWMFWQLRQEYDNWVAGAIASVIFALLHLLWERKKTIPQLPGLWLMGMVLVQARLTANDSIALAWGLHSGWIWVLASLSSAQLISYKDNVVSPWLIGFFREPLAGLIGISLLLGTGIICYVI
ncbi:MAG: CPBP family intramembrane metalloprotease [Gloeocapsa sp. DLM2.Bin57]|nr:MAG: CPBP family intramembrane metalloprotease [Gloeocapsa sp. DLM2.Bin57]